MAKPNLALIPATIGDKVYSILPSDGVGDFDFTRGTVATRINAQGLIETVASGENRLNYSLLDGEVAGCPHLLLEPQRANLLQYSEDFSQWVNSNSSDLSNQLISPDGTLNADKLITNNGSINGQVTKSISKSSSAITYTYSVFAKKGEWNRCNLYVSDTATFNNRAQFFVDLETGEVIQATTTGAFSSASGFSENYGNGWFRFSITFTTSTETSITARIYSIDSVVTTGDGTSGIYIFGAMLEEGSYPTSYIKSNSGSATTRAAETCNGSGNAATFNDSEGVFMAELLWTATSSNVYISIDDNTSNNRILIYSNSTEDIKALIRSGGFNQAAFTATNQDPTTFNKVAVKYKQNDFALWINGIKLLTDTLGSTPIGLSNLGFRAGGGTNPLHGSNKQIQYFDSALSDTELEQLTSWDSFRAMAQSQLYTIE